MTDDVGPVVVTLERWLEPIMPRYLEIRAREQQALSQALADDDMALARLIGHRTKGSGAAYGLPAVTEMGRHIEMAAQEGDRKRVREYVQKLADYMGRLDIRYEGDEESGA